jgi:pteridine reductase
VSESQKYRTSQSSTRTALVTGAARRIGACIAETLHQRGCDVFLHYHSSSDSVDDLAARLNKIRPDSATVVQADLGSSDDIENMADQVRSATDSLELLVNNASQFFPTTVGSTSAQEWDDLMNSNLRGAYFLTQALLPELAVAGGSIVMMTLALAKELGPQVRVNGVAPGAILWPENESSSELQQAILKRTVMGRAGEPQDIASAVVYLGLDAPYVTGQVLAVDGGRSLNI